MTRIHDEAEVAARVIDRSTSAAQVAVKESADRRANPRYAMTLSVSLVGDHNFYQGLTENLSEGGLFVQTQYTLPIGTKLRVEFTLPTSSAPISAVAEVRWVRLANAVCDEHDNFGSGGADCKPGMGIQFTGLSDQSVNAIVKFMKMRTPEFYLE